MQEDSSSYFFLDAQNDTVGPHSLAELETLAVQGTITADTMIASEGWSEWRPWGQIVGEGQTSSLTPQVQSETRPVGEDENLQPPVRPVAETQSAGLLPNLTEANAPTPVGAVTGEVLEAPYPWQVPSALAARIEAYDAVRNYQSFLCKCNEFLNGVAKNQAFKALRDADGEIRVYPGIVGVNLRQEGPGYLARMIAMLPEWLRPVAIFLLNVVRFCLGAVAFLLGGGLFGIAIMILSVMVALLLLVLLWYIVIPGIIAAGIAAVLWERYNERQLPIIARRILAQPKSPYAIRKLRRYCRPIVPRYWRKDDQIGQVAQILRAETRYRLLRQSLVVVVQDNPIERRRRFLPPGIGLRAERRIFVFAMDGGEPAADQAAAAMSAVLGVPVRLAEFRSGLLVPL